MPGGGKRVINTGKAECVQPGPSNEGTPQTKRRKSKSGKQGSPKSSPKKLKKGKTSNKSTAKDLGVTTFAKFVDDSMEMVFEVTNQEEDQFLSGGEQAGSPEDDGIILKGVSENNNATISRANQFRRMVACASEQNSVDGDRISQRMSSENHSVSAEEGEASDSDFGNESFESVKILPWRQENIDKEEEEMKVARDEIIEKAVDKTIEKLATFLKGEGLVLTKQDNLHHDKSSKKQPEHPTGKNNPIIEGSCTSNLSTEINDKLGKILEQSSSATTIYDRAVQPASVNQTTLKRVSTSSEEMGDTSDEMMDVMGSQINCIVWVSDGDEQERRQ